MTGRRCDRAQGGAAARKGVEPQSSRGDGRGEGSSTYPWKGRAEGVGGGGRRVEVQGVEEVEGGATSSAISGYISPISPLHLPYISLHLPYISLHLLGHLGLHAAHLAQREGARRLGVEARALGAGRGRVRVRGPLERIGVGVGLGLGFGLG